VKTETQLRGSHPSHKALNRWVMIAIGFVIELVLGQLYAWSVFVLPLEKEFGWVRSQTSLAFTVSLICFPLGMMVGGRLTDRRGIRLTGSISAVLLALGFLLTSWTGSLPWLVVSYGVVAGFALGIGTNTLTNLVSWFPDKRGLAAGALAMGFGLAGLLLGSMTNNIITVLGWRTAFRILAAIAFVVCLGGFQFVRKAPAGWKPAGWTPPPATRTSLSHTLADVPPAQMLRSQTFWLLELWLFLISAAGFMMMGHIVPMAVELGIGQTTAVLAMGTLSLANGLGRPTYGALSDRFGRTGTMFLCALLMSLAIFFAIPLTQKLGYPGLIVAVVLIGSSYGGIVPQSQALIMQLFGTRHFGTNLGISTIQMMVSGILGPQLAGLLRTSTGSYDTAFAIIGVLTLGACLATVLFSLNLRRLATASARPLPG
jgi:OFA family oxalate/formate antiporter-like MFS transporter